MYLAEAVIDLEGVQNRKQDCIQCINTGCSKTEANNGVQLQFISLPNLHISCSKFEKYTESRRFAVQNTGKKRKMFLWNLFNHPLIRRLQQKFKVYRVGFLRQKLLSDGWFVMILKSVKQASLNILCFFPMFF